MPGFRLDGKRGQEKKKESPTDINHIRENDSFRGSVSNRNCFFIIRIGIHIVVHPRIVDREFVLHEMTTENENQSVVLWLPGRA